MDPIQLKVQILRVHGERMDLVLETSLDMIVAQLNVRSSLAMRHARLRNLHGLDLIVDGRFQTSDLLLSVLDLEKRLAPIERELVLGCLHFVDAHTERLIDGVILRLKVAAARVLQRYCLLAQVAATVTVLRAQLTVVVGEGGP